MAVSTRSAPRGLGEFLAVLEQRLAALPVEDLRAALVAHAERLPVRDREAFLAIFPAPSAISQVPGPHAVPSLDGARLLADIDAFVDRVRSGAFFEGWGWDDDLREERAWGDESWVGEMDDLFAAAADAFLAGDLALARDAYGRLLGAFDLDQEVGTFCGPSSPSDMVTTDVPEAVARYLRVVYETTPLPERAEEFYDQYADLGHLAPATSLHTIADTRRAGLPDADEFLPAWIEVLTEQTSGYWARDRQRLLTEATVWHAGTDGLATVARRPGDHQPTAYLDWIDALTRDGRLDDAAAAAREAMTLTGLPAERSAEVADWLGELTARLGDAQAALDARRTAWRAHRTRSRLLALVAAAEAVGQRAVTLSAEADLVPADRDRLGCELLLLAGRIDTAAALAVSDPLGWSGPEHPGPVVWPVLLAAAVAPVVPADEEGRRRQQIAAWPRSGVKWLARAVRSAQNCRMSSDVLAALLGESRALSAVLHSLTPGDLGRPTNCPPWDLQELVVHIAASIRVGDAPFPAAEFGAEVHDAADYYRRPERATSTYRQDNVDGTRRLAQRVLATTSAVEWFDEVLGEAADALGAQPIDRVVDIPRRGAMRLSDWVLTRVVSVAAHGLDVAITLGRDPWTTPEALRTVRPVFVALLGRRPPDALGWDDQTLLAVASGRQAVTDHERDLLGSDARRFPLLS
jgi:uncharacterized protein (TIGR03083 family)